MLLLINFKTFDLVIFKWTFKIPLRLHWIKKLRSKMDVSKRWKYNQLHMNFNMDKTQNSLNFKVFKWKTGQESGF